MAVSTVSSRCRSTNRQSLLPVKREVSIVAVEVDPVVLPPNALAFLELLHDVRLARGGGQGRVAGPSYRRSLSLDAARLVRRAQTTARGPHASLPGVPLSPRKGLVPPLRATCIDRRLCVSVT